MTDDQLHILKKIAEEAKEVRDHLNQLCTALDLLYITSNSKEV